MNAILITFNKCAAIEDDYYMFASKPDDLDDSSEFTRIFYFDDQAPENKWRHLDIPYFSTICLCVVKSALGSQRKYAALSKNGDISYYWPGGQGTEKIVDAGLKKVAPMYGYLNSLKEIDGCLYACGGGGQIYVRDANQWHDIAGELRSPAPTIKPNHAINQFNIGDDIADIDGYSAKDLYAVGRNGIYHFNGHSWRLCQVFTDEIMMSVICASNGVIWTCGFNGTILRGNAASGFEAVSHYDDDMILTKMAFYRDHIYFASNEGLFLLDYTKEKSRLQKIDEIVECEDISVVGDTLLCIGSKSIYILDKHGWRELKHPDHT
ncbi:hypothetical protein MH117_18655 [Paenibacillus sp. ACRRX]|uniref:hypothetical protein n=1 Tax=Paenibacillus sp. ACRRX TaxID=2918206 RepID=UPI001EF553F5|nr:hypothetical protein [Paenibacillus sp. ACRRX]MCG7409434.1 hypothetical protein [Paenibacillus sp. ACRRX]